VRIETGREGGRVVVRAEGEIDVRTAPGLRRALDEAVAAGSGDLVVDMAAVTFLDSSGLGVLLGRLRRMPPGRRLVLRRPRPTVRALLDLAGVTRLVAVEDGEGGQGRNGG
jgi:stage II sporulation protein AA (anti-sigma F factor antagonist)